MPEILKQSEANIAFIPARGGSKGIPKKNLYELAGKPLVFYTIDAAIESKCFDQIWVSTDNEAIAERCRESYSKHIRILTRPCELSSDNSRVEDAMLFHLKTEEVIKGFITLLQPTSPLRSAIHIQEAMTKFEKANCTSLISVEKLDFPGQKLLVVDELGNFKPILTWDHLGKPRQELGFTYKPNGAIYLTSIPKFVKSEMLYNEQVTLFEMYEPNNLDIDTVDDLKLASICIESFR